MFDCNNLYVLNKKDQNALVYRDSMGNISRLTRDLFGSDEEFEYWKKWSDEDYHTEEKERHIFADNTLYLDGMSEEAATTDSPENLFVDFLTSQERVEMCDILMEKYNNCLTAAQKRRIWLHFVEGKSLREIASIEDASFLSIYESINAAKHKILKRIKKTP